MAYRGNEVEWMAHSMKRLTRMTETSSRCVSKTVTGFAMRQGKLLKCELPKIESLKTENIFDVCPMTARVNGLVGLRRQRTA